MLSYSASGEMKNKAGNEEDKRYLTRGSVLDDLGFSASETLEIKVKAEIYRDLLEYIRERGFTQLELGTALGIHQPDVSNLLNGRVSKFSVGKLIKLAGRLNLEARVTIKRPKAAKLPVVAASHQSRRRVAAPA
jgi:predicted XRE-type DNA-binding protein